MAHWGTPAHERALHRLTIETAERILAEGKPLTKAELGFRMGITADYARARLARARRVGMTTLNVVTEKNAARRSSLPVVSGNPLNHRGEDRADPAAILEVLTDAHRGMGDGRGEIDDPRKLGPCFSGKSHAASPLTQAEACRKYLGEWRRIRRGLPTIKPRPVEEGLPHCVGVARRPAKRRDAMFFGKQVQRHHHAD